MENVAFNTENILSKFQKEMSTINEVIKKMLITRAPAYLQTNISLDVKEYKIMNICLLYTSRCV